MTLTLKQRITTAWLFIALGIALIIAIDEVRFLHDYSHFTILLPFAAFWPALLIFMRLATDFRPPRWMRILGWCLGGVILFGVPALSLFRASDATRVLFLVCVAPAIAVFLLGVTAHAWRHRADPV